MLACSDIPVPKTIGKTFFGQAYTPDLRAVTPAQISERAEIGRASCRERV